MYCKLIMQSISARGLYYCTPASHLIAAEIMDFLKSAVAAAGIAKGPSLPFSFAEQVPLDQSIWKLYNGNKKV